jgi:hypothetical protein
MVGSILWRKGGFMLAKIIIINGLLFSPLSYADEGESKETKSDPSFRCEKIRSQKLTDLKEKMLENCNLNKPFSSSVSVFAGEDTYLYCCHVRSK